MKKASLFFLSLLLAATLYSQDSLLQFTLPDTARSISFYAELPLLPGGKGKGTAAIGSSGLTLQLGREGRGWQLRLQAPAEAVELTRGLGVTGGKGTWRFFHGGVDTGRFKLLLVKAIDTAAHASLWSGYVFLPGLQKWKLIAGLRLPGEGYITEAAAFYATGQQRLITGLEGLVFQRANGRWQRAEGEAVAAPTINWLGEADSAARAEQELRAIRQAIRKGTLPALEEKGGIFYRIDEMGSGRAVSVTDTVSVYYKGYLLKDSSVFDQTAAGKPARFPLNRLIRGWQLGIPLIREGGRITLVIPSGLAYSIRTRSPRIPPNSVLVFEIGLVKGGE
jgi:FKBP-type peptidyl-prolyl cis-trans isomerase FkpA